MNLYNVGMTSDGRVYIQDEDFTHDARLYVNGDFYDMEQERTYMEMIAGMLNAKSSHEERRDLLVKIERMQRKFNKERDRCAKMKSELDTIKRTLELLPGWKIQITNYNEHVKERERVKALEARVKEQALLIEKMLKAGAR